MATFTLKKISELFEASDYSGLYTIGVDALNRSVKISLSWMKNTKEEVETAASAAQEAAKAAASAAVTANAAAGNANSKADLANSKAEAAASAADEAKAAVEAAGRAEAAANAAASNANAKAGAADRAAASATAAANNANSKADLADGKAGAAQEAAKTAADTAEQARATIARLEELEKSLVGQYKMIPTGMTLNYPRRVTLGNSALLRIAYELLPSDTGRNVLFLGDNGAVSVLPDGGITVNRAGTSVIHVIPTENTSIYQTIRITVTAPALRKAAASSLRLLSGGRLRLL